MIFYSLVGPKGSEFKINELVLDVYVRDVGKTATTKFVCERTSIKKSRAKQNQIIAEADIDIDSKKYVLTSIAGHVKWKATKGATLKVKLFKGEDEFANSEFTVAKIERDASSEDFTSEDFEFLSQDHSKDEVFMPRPREEG